MKRFAAVFVLIGFAWACGSSPPPKPPMKADDTSPSETADDPDASSAAWAHEDPDAGAGEGGAAIASGGMQGSEDGAKTLLAQFVAPGADHAALTKSLKPTTADYKALFDGASAAKIESAQAKSWESGKAAIKPKEGQTEIKVVSATGADLAAGKGAEKEFSPEYKKFGKHILPTATLYRFKFVKPGEEKGTAYDGLAFVNNHWVIAPQPYRALAGKSSNLDDAAGGDDGAKPAKKPKGKGKKKK